MTDIFNLPNPKIRDLAAELRKTNAELTNYSNAVGERDRNLLASEQHFNIAKVLGDALDAQQERQEKATKAFQKEIEANPSLALNNVVPWDTIKANTPNFDQLPYDQQLTTYNQYVKGTVEGLTKQYPKLDADDLAMAVRSKFPPPVDPTGGSGDFMRGLKQYLPQTKGLFEGAAGYALDKLGAHDLGQSLMRSAQENFDASNKLSKKTDSFTEASKEGLGGLVDWAQYTVGNQIGTLLESFATGAIGAAIGGAAGEGVGAIPGAAIGFVGKSLVRDEVKKLLVKGLVNDVKSQVAKGIPRAEAIATAEAAMQKALYKAAGQTFGQVAGMYANSTAMGVGQIVQQAQQAGVDPRTLDISRVGPAAALFALAETASDKFMLDGLLHGTSIGGNMLGRAAFKAANTAAIEGGTEVAQDYLTNYGANQEAPTGDQLLNDFMAGALVGGGAGFIGGGLHAPPKEAAAKVTPESILAGAGGAAAPTGGARTNIEGADLVQGPDGKWAYAEGATPNDTASGFIRENGGDPTATIAPAGGGEAPTAAPAADLAPADTAAPVVGLLPAPDTTINVTPEGVAITPEQAAAAQAEQTALGTSPQGQEAAAQHPGFAGPADVAPTPEAAPMPEVAPQAELAPAVEPTPVPQVEPQVTDKTPADFVPPEQAGAGGAQVAPAETTTGTGPVIETPAATIPKPVRDALTKYGYSEAQINAMSQDAATFNSVFHKTAEAHGIPKQLVDQLINEVDRHSEGLPVPLTTSTPTDHIRKMSDVLQTAIEERPIRAPNGGVYLSEASPMLRSMLNANPGVGVKLSKAVHAAARAVEGREIKPHEGSNLGYLSSSLGYGNRLQGSTSPWAKTLRSGVGGTRAVLNAIVKDKSTGQSTRQGAQLVLDIMNNAKIKNPSISAGTIRQMGVGVGGDYSPAKHHIRIARTAGPDTVVHEALHAVSSLGLIDLQHEASRGNRLADSISFMIFDMQKQMRQALGGEGQKYYGAQRIVDSKGNLNLHEAFAELTRPEFLALAAQTKYVPSERAQLAYDTLNAKPSDTIFDMIAKTISTILNFISPKSSIDSQSVAQMLARVMPELSERTANFHPAMGENISEPIARPAFLENAPEVLQHAQTAPSFDDDTHGAAEDIEPQGPAFDRQRGSSASVLEGIQSGQPAAPATPWRGFAQAVKTRNWGSAKQSLIDVARVANLKFHDHLQRWVDFAMALPVPDEMKQRIVDTMRLAPNRRDEIMSHIRHKYGEALYNDLGKAAKDQKVTAETAEHEIGYAITARYIEAANQKLIDEDARKVRVLTNLYRRRQTEGVRRQLEAARDALNKRIAAVHNPDITTKVHTVPLAGNMNNAQARAIMRLVEDKYGRETVDKIAGHIYDMNSYNLMVSLASGKANPMTVAKFLKRPDLVDQFRELRELAKTTDANDATSFERFNQLTDRLQAEVRSNYVPFTGNPDTALNTEMIHTGGAIPNTSADRRMQGRMTSAPDNAIRATIGAILKNSSYAGWSHFQDAIADAYWHMTPEQRKEAGMTHKVLSDNQSGDMQAAIVRRRNNRAIAYMFNDEKLIPALRNAYALDVGSTIPLLGKATKLYSFAATQLNPFFAPKNLMRDAGERTEVMRTRNYSDASGNRIDSNKMARSTLAMLANPMKLKTILNLGRQYGVGIPINTSTLEGRYMQEAINNGAFSFFGKTFSPNIAQIAKEIDKHKGSLRHIKQGFSHVVETYNRAFDLATPLATYISMREAGMSQEAASAGVLDLMNFRKRGEWMAGPNSWWAFAQASVTGGVNMIRALNTTRGKARFVAQAAILLALQSALRSMADDDEGGNRLDQQSDLLHNKNLLVPFGKDGILKLPIPYGMMQLANSVARSLLGFSQSEHEKTDIGKAVGDVVSGGLIPSISPLEDSQIDWSKRPLQAALTLISPSIAKPIVATAMNRSSFDTEIVNSKWQKNNEYASEQFGSHVPPFYKDVAIELRKLIGVDMAPEQVRELIKGYPLGAFGMILNGAVENPYKEEIGRPTASPLADAFYAPLSDAGRYFKFKDAIERTDELQRKINAGDLDEDNLDAKDQAALDWRNWWDKQDSKLRTAKAKISRSGLSGEAQAERRKAEDKKRQAAQFHALYLYRTNVTHQPSTETSP